MIDCLPTKESILIAIKKLYSKEFQESLNEVINPYGNGGASKAIVKVLNKTSFDDLLKKKFYNINF